MYALQCRYTDNVASKQIVDRTGGLRWPGAAADYGEPYLFAIKRFK